MKCFDYHNKNKTKCQRNSCRYWIDTDQNSNCCIVLSKNENKMTLEEIGKFFKVTRMRICQIEKKAIKKIRELIL
jgi:DNA-directed RNA polymerase specialized sigma subunit